MDAQEKRKILKAMLEAAIDAADPASQLSKYLPAKPSGRCIVVGAGKSSAAMARALELAWPDVDLSGAVVTRYGHAVPTQKITVYEAAHPVPDEAGFQATEKILQIAASAQSGDLVLALISGGGSALLTAPRPPLTASDKHMVNRLLLKSGLAIDDMNRIRRRLSLVKGGGLARAAQGARLVTLAISDVPNDLPEAIASGPTVPDLTAHEDLRPLLAKLGAGLPLAARDLLSQPSKPVENFEPDFRLIATPQQSLKAAADIAQSAGITPILLGDALEGEACEVGKVLAGIARSVATHGTPAQMPAVLLSGGETTVSIGASKPGRGGRNTEFLLSLAVALNRHADITALAADTDGIDGTEDAAGAWVDPTTLQRAEALGLNPIQFLENHDSYSLFQELGDLIITGPTLTNVNDFRAILIS